VLACLNCECDLPSGRDDPTAVLLPLNNVREVPADTNITLSFSEYMYRGLGSITIRDLKTGISNSYVDQSDVVARRL